MATAFGQSASLAMVIPAATISQAHIQNRGAFRVAQRIYPATACLFIGNLDNEFSDNELAIGILYMTAQCGLPCNVDVRTPRRKENGDIRPFAYAQFATTIDADAAYAILHGQRLGKRHIRVQPSKAHVICVARQDGRPLSPESAVLSLVGRRDAAKITHIMDFGEKTIALAFENVGLALDMWAELRDSGESLSGGKVILRGPFGYCQG